VDRPQELTHISLCAGYGGIDLGLQRALGAVRTVAFSEIESYACANLVAKMEQGLLDSAPIWTDLKTFPWSEFHGKVDLVSGGFPCQPFSTSGRRAGDSDPRHLWPHIVRGLRELGRPPLVFFENVEGIISSKLAGNEWSDPQGTPVLQHVLRELERLGYTATAGIFSAAEVGAPHQRKRVFILGVRADLGAGGRELVNGLLGDAARVHSKHSLWWRQSTQQSVPVPTREPSTDADMADNGGAWPAGRGAKQYAWEPPRVVLRGGTVDYANDAGSHGRNAHERTDTEEGRHGTSGCATSASTPRGAVQGNSEPSVGGDSDGAPCGLDYAQLCVSRDSLVDELRLLGNGVVPATAERAFKVLWGELTMENAHAIYSDQRA